MRAFLSKIRLYAIIIIFFILLSLTFIAFTLDSFTEEENMKSFIVNFQLSRITNSSDIEALYDIHLENCKNGAIEQKVKYGDSNRTLNCDDILASTKENYVSLIIEKFVFEDMYNRNYPCTFLQCFNKRETWPVIFSAQGRRFINSIKVFLVLGTIISALLVAVLSETVGKALKRVGWAFFIIGGAYFSINYIPVKQINWWGNIINLDLIIPPVFSSITIPALIVMIIGISMLIGGIVHNYLLGRGIIAKIVHKKEKIKR